MKKVIIAEKPSVAKNIADALNIKTRKDGYFEGTDYIVTWAFGHLLQLFDAKDYDENMKSWRMDKFPFIPNNFKYKVKMNSEDRSKTDEGANKQIKLIKALIEREDVDGVISATDFDREGQVIADEIFMYLKEKKPIYRMLLNEWTQSEVNKGLKNLILNSKMQSLQDAGIGRQWADWIIGANLTSVSTLKYSANNKILNIGRVLLPTLKIIYDKDMEIEKFKSTTYHKLVGTFKTQKKDEFEAIYYVKEADKLIEKFNDKNTLLKLADTIKNKNGQVTSKEVINGKEYAPSLFNLTGLQGFVTSKYKGWTSDKVLKIAQSLYEKKFTTYPRTGSIALDESLKEKAKKVLETLKNGSHYAKNLNFTDNKRIFDNSKVEGHSAIIPTYLIPKDSDLSKDEKIVYNTVKNRFLAQFMPVAEYEETKIVIKMDSPAVNGLFLTKGKVQTVQGWKLVEETVSKDNILPMVAEKEILNLTDAKVSTVITKPPKPHTEKTLLRIMETCGKSFKGDENSKEMMDSILSGFSIGTPATRAETIKKLKDVGYINAKDRYLTCSELGKNLVESFPAKELFDLEYTGKLEKTLSDIEKGKVKKEDFLELITKFTLKAVDNIKKDSSKLNDVSVISSTAESLGTCPECGSPIIEGTKGFGCSNWKSGCKFIIWKEDKYLAAFKKKPTKAIVKKLLKNGKIEFKDLKSKTGSTYAASFSYEKDITNDRYHWKMEFINDKKNFKR